MTVVLVTGSRSSYRDLGQGEYLSLGEWLREMR
jgi:hypothetical protein